MLAEKPAPKAAAKAAPKFFTPSAAKTVPKAAAKKPSDDDSDLGLGGSDDDLLADAPKAAAKAVVSSVITPAPKQASAKKPADKDDDSDLGLGGSDDELLVEKQARENRVAMPSVPSTLIDRRNAYAASPSDELSDPRKENFKSTSRDEKFRAASVPIPTKTVDTPPVSIPVAKSLSENKSESANDSFDQLGDELIDMKFDDEPSSVKSLPTKAPNPISDAISSFKAAEVAVNPVTAIGSESELNDELQVEDLEDDVHDHSQGQELSDLRQPDDLTRSPELRSSQPRLPEVGNLAPPSNSSLVSPKLSSQPKVASNPEETGCLDLSSQTDLLSLTRAIEPFSYSDSALRVLILSKCELTSVPSPLPPNLEKIDLSHNALTSLSLMDAVPLLTILSVQNNKLRSLKGLARNVRLMDIQASNNLISTLDSIGHLQELRVIALTNNQLKSIGSLRLLSLNTSLRTVSLEGNPIEKEKGFRLQFKNLLPKVLLDTNTPSVSATVAPPVIQTSSDDPSARESKSGSRISMALYRNGSISSPSYLNLRDALTILQGREGLIGKALLQTQTAINGVVANSQQAEFLSAIPVAIVQKWIRDCGLIPSIISGPDLKLLLEEMFGPQMTKLKPTLSLVQVLELLTQLAVRIAQSKLYAAADGTPVPAELPTDMIGEILLALQERVLPSDVTSASNESQANKWARMARPKAQEIKLIRDGEKSVPFEKVVSNGGGSGRSTANARSVASHSGSNTPRPHDVPKNISKGSTSRTAKWGLALKPPTPTFAPAPTPKGSSAEERMAKFRQREFGGITSPRQTLRSFKAVQLTHNAGSALTSPRIKRMAPLPTRGSAVRVCFLAYSLRHFYVYSLFA